jgi:hypothetical protein
VLPTDHAPPWLPADEPVREEALGEDDPTAVRAEASESL